MTAPGTLWRQIHQLAKIVDRHAVEGQTVDLVATELHALPTAQRQNIQRDLYLLSRWLHVLTHKHVDKPAVPKTFFARTHAARKRSSAAGWPEQGEAKELARSLSELDTDGSPVPENDND